MPGVVMEDLDAIYQRTGAEARAERDKLQAELDELNEERAAIVDAIRKLDKLLNFIDPPKPKQKKRGGRGPTGETVARQTELTEWLRSHLNGEQFVAPELLGRKDFEAVGMSKSYLAKSLNDLQEQGVVRLVRVGHRDYGARTKIWEVIRSGSKT
jgi:hypothetical protein